MATIRVTGLDEWIAKLDTMTSKTEGLCKRAVWEGGRVVADSVKPALNGIPVQDHYVPKGQMRKGLTSEQKAGVINGFGLSKMKNEGGKISTKAGFEGMTDGVHNSALMRRVESGTSYQQKHPIIRPAVNRARAAAKAAMQSRFEEDVQTIMNS